MRRENSKINGFSDIFDHYCAFKFNICKYSKLELERILIQRRHFKVEGYFNVLCLTGALDARPASKSSAIKMFLMQKQWVPLLTHSVRRHFVAKTFRTKTLWMWTLLGPLFIGWCLLGWWLWMYLIMYKWSIFVNISNKTMKRTMFFSALHTEKFWKNVEKQIQEFFAAKICRYRGNFGRFEFQKFFLNTLKVWII